MLINFKFLIVFSLIFILTPFLISCGGGGGLLAARALVSRLRSRSGPRATAPRSFRPARTLLPLPHPCRHHLALASRSAINQGEGSRSC